MAFIDSILQGKVRPLVAILLGAFIPLSLAPFNFYPLSVVSLIGLHYLWRNANAKSAAYSGWLFGLGMYGTGVSWIYVSIHDFAYTPAITSAITTLAFVAGLALLLGLQGFLYGYLKLQRCNLLAFPALWVLFEWIRSWLLTGFPWLYVGYGMIDTPLSEFAPLFGVFGVSLATCFCASLIYIIASANNKKRLPATAALMALAIICFGLPFIDWVKPSTDKPLKVSLIQGNIAQELKWNLDQQPIIMGLYREKTQQNWDSDLIIWPEAAIPAYLHEISDYIEPLNEAAKNNNSTLITGIPYLEYGPQGEIIFFNSIIAIGNGSGIYHKQKLVPFGEFIPFQNQIRGMLPFLDLPMSSFTRGLSTQKNLTANHLNIAPFVCYEILYPGFVASRSQNADLLITISNDAWFGRSIGPDQHFEMARMRALELGKPLLRSTNNGITAHIDHKGKVVVQAPSYQVFTLNSEVNLTNGKTPYARWGSTPIISLCVLLIACGLVFARRASSRDENAPQTQSLANHQ